MRLPSSGKQAVQFWKIEGEVETKNLAFPAPRSGDGVFAGFRSVLRSARYWSTNGARRLSQIDRAEMMWESRGMIGWHISVYRQKDGGAAAATAASSQGTRLAVWQTGLHGLRWLDELVKSGNAIDLGGNGYPLRFTATAEHLVPRIKQPPEANAVWVCGPQDILTDKWAGKTVVELDAIAQCRIGEWLLVEAWDES